MKNEGVLAIWFSLGEIRTLRFDLGVDHDNLPGNTKPTKALELILHRSRLAELASAVRRERPDAGL
ncbi:MAG: Effector-associated domain 7 [Chloroflexota bacterium]|jgi:hypothetical protein